VIQLPRITPFPLPEPIRDCPTCGAALPLGALACPECHALIHGEQLLRLTTAAKTLEKDGDPYEARNLWLQALALLPRDSTQAQWILEHTAALQRASPAPKDDHGWAAKLGPLAPIAIFLAKSKAVVLAIFKLKFLLSLGTFVALYWALYGFKFGAGFAALILLHEMGHYLDIRRRGLPADMPVFLPGLGAYVRWEAMGVSRETRAGVSLAGPAAGFIGAVLCVLLYRQYNYGLWAALAHSSAVLNVLNLTPVWILDGGQAVSALFKTDRIILLIACLLLWLVAGQGIYFLVAAGVTYRLFTKDFPPQTSRRTLIYYLALLGGYALLLHIVPAAAK
jgi:Zn-dependent protease